MENLSVLWCRMFLFFFAFGSQPSVRVLSKFLNVLHSILPRILQCMSKLNWNDHISHPLQTISYCNDSKAFFFLLCKYLSSTIYLNTFSILDELMKNAVTFLYIFNFLNFVSDANVNKNSVNNNELELLLEIQ